MGKRKSKKVVVKKTSRPRMETVFTCPLCTAERCVDVRIDRPRQTAHATCRACRAGYTTVITALTEPTDVYHEWIDEVDAQKQRRSGEP